MEKSYVERRPAGLYLSGSRVPLDCIVREYWNGEAPENIQRNYPSLSLEQVFGAIAFYLANQAEVDAIVLERERIEDAALAAHPVPPELKQRLERARQPSRAR